MNKNLIIMVTVLLSFGITLMTAPKAEASISSLGFHYSSQSSTVGSDIVMNLTYNTGTNSVCMIDYVFNYPTNIYELKGAPSSKALFNTILAADYSTPGRIHYVQSHLGCTTTSIATDILGLEFHIKAAGTGTISFSSINAMGGVTGEDVINVAAGSSLVGSTDSVTETVPVVTTPDTVSNANTNSSAGATTTKKTNTNSRSSSTATPTPTVSGTPASAAVSTVALATNAVFDMVAKTSTGIIFTGTAEPNSIVNISIKDSSLTGTSQTDANGAWSYETKVPLTDGVHTVTISSTKDGKTSAESATEFVVDSNTKSIALGKILQGDSSNTEDAAATIPTSSTTDKGTDMKWFIIIAVSSIALFFIVVAVLYIVKRKKISVIAGEIGGAKGYVNQAVAPASIDPSPVQEGTADFAQKEVPAADSEESIAASSPLAPEQNSSSVPQVQKQPQAQPQNTSPFSYGTGADGAKISNQPVAQPPQPVPVAPVTNPGPVATNQPVVENKNVDSGL